MVWARTRTKAKVNYGEIRVGLGLGLGLEAGLEAGLGLSLFQN